MFVVGDIDENAKKLLQVTYDCWILACQSVQRGNHYQSIGRIIEDYVEKHSFTTVPNICGHGIGTVLHCAPDIYHHRNKEKTGIMLPGHTFTIEPMICEGSADILTWPDEWTITTKDGKRSAQFEHTLLVTNDGGVEALTAKTRDSMVQFWERESQIHSGFWLGTSESARKQEDEINVKLGL